MGENSGRASWNKCNNDFPSLRRPHNAAPPSTSFEPPRRITGVLSPNAPEFVPQGYNNSSARNFPEEQNMYSLTNSFNKLKTNPPIQNRFMPPHSMHGHMNNSHPVQSHNNHHPGNNQGRHNNQYNTSIQNRLNVHNVHDGHSNNAASHNSYGASHENSSEQSEEESIALNYIIQIVKCLNEDPGLFDSIENQMLNVFDGFGNNEFVLSNAMEIIFNQSIEEQNFRYMGAKLYRLLDSIVAHQNSVFKTLLTLKLAYHRAEVFKYMQNEQYKVRGTTLFLAELYMQLRNNGSRINEIAHNIVFTMDQLLQKTTPENIKCICLTLKLAGYDLEMDCRDEISQIIEKLKKVDSVDVSTGRVLETVLKLPNNNWGREIINHQTPITNDPAINYSDEPVFYGPDGQVMTEEENSFLESNIPYDAQNDEDDDSEELELDPGMTDEMELAYKEFLKNNPNSSTS